MAEEEKIDFEEEEKKAEQEEKEIMFEDTEGAFVAHPKVGEETGIITVNRFYTSTNVRRNTKDGTQFSIGLRQTDGKELAYLLDTDKGTYTCGSWEEVGKIKAIAKQVKDKTEAKGRIKGFKINIKHIEDGGIATRNPEEVSKLKEVTIEEAKVLIEKSKKAKKEKKCYEIVLIE